MPAIELVFVYHYRHGGPWTFVGAAYHTPNAFHYNIRGGPKDAGGHGYIKFYTGPDFQLGIHVEEDASGGDVVGFSVMLARVRPPHLKRQPNGKAYGTAKFVQQEFLKLE